MADPGAVEGEGAKDELKLSGYAYETIDRVVANYDGEMLKLPRGTEAVRNMDQIVRSWHDDKVVESFIQTFNNLAINASQQNDTERAEGNRTQASELDKKLQTDRSFKDMLRRGGIGGQIIGAKLLSWSRWDPSLLQEPLVVAGGNLVIDFLKSESENDRAILESPEKSATLPENVLDYLKTVSEDTLRTTEEITDYIAKVREIQQAKT